MSEESTPREYSDRELTMRAITLTFQRAQQAQHELTSEVVAPADGGPGEPGPTAENGPGEAGSARLGDESDEAGLDRAPPLDLVDRDEEADLPNPLVTDANLRHFLEQATAAQGDPDTEGSRSRAAAARAAIGSRSEQVRFNSAIVNALHQLDHRSRLQQRTIARLEAELADARRALAALESGGRRRA